MANGEQPVNTGEEISNTPPSSLALDSQAQFRTLSRRVEELSEQIKKFDRPNKFRMADAVQIGAILITIIVALISAFGLNNRIDDLVKGQSGIETRISSQITASEGRLGARVDRLDDRLAKIGERTATLEGGRGK